MKAIASILLFSGIQNPEQELSEELSKELREDLLKLNRPSARPFHSKLGYAGFVVYWDDEVGFYVRDGVVKVHSPEYGWEEMDGCFADTLGIESKIRKELSELIIEWGGAMGS